MVDPDPFITLPLPSRGPTEPSDFLARLSDAVAASARTSAWFRSVAPQPTDELQDS